MDFLSELTQLISTAAVVISLLYLARQMRQSTAMARAKAYQSFVEQQGALTMAFLADERLTSVFGRAVTRRVPLAEFKDEDQTAVIMLCVLQARVYETMFRQVREGLLKEEDLHLVANITFLESPAFRDTWPRVSRALSPDFVEYFNKRHGPKDN